MGRPAASAEVQPAGRSLLECKSKMAPEPAFQPRPWGYAENSSYNFQLSRSMTRTWRSPLDLGPPSMGASFGMGYGPGSLSSLYSNWIGTLGCLPLTTTYGMPLGAPS